MTIMELSVKLKFSRKFSLGELEPSQSSKNSLYYYLRWDHYLSANRYDDTIAIILNFSTAHSRQFRPGPTFFFYLVSARQNNQIYTNDNQY